MKNRKGFTLMEMVVVIAIIVFLSAVTLTSIAQYTKRARDLSTNVRAHNAAMASEEEIVDNYLTTTRSTEGNATTNNSHQAIVPTESETESTAEATTTKKQNPPPPQDPPHDPPHEDPTTVTTTKSQETQPNNPPAQGGEGSVTTTNTGSKYVKSLTSPEGMKVESVNYNDWGGDIQLKNTKDFLQYQYITITVKVEGNGKFSQVNGADIKSISADKKTISITIKNNSNLPYYKDSNFAKDGNPRIYFNFESNQGGNMNITVTSSN